MKSQNYGIFQSNAFDWNHFEKHLIHFEFSIFIVGIVTTPTKYILFLKCCNLNKTILFNEHPADQFPATSRTSIDEILLVYGNLSCMVTTTK